MFQRTGGQFENAGGGASDGSAREIENFSARRGQSAPLPTEIEKTPRVGLRGLLERTSRAPERHPVASAFCSIPLGAAMVAGEALAPVVPGLLFMLYVLIAAAAFLRGLVEWVRRRDPPRPRAPRRPIAKRSRVPREPKRLIHEIAHNCVICGRPLTNRESMRARVGSTCIKRYGPRFKLIENPDHATWRRTVAAAEMERAAKQSRLDAEFDRAVVLHQERERAWAAEVAATAGQERRQQRKAASRLVASSVASAPLLLVGIGCALAFR